MKPPKMGTAWKSNPLIRSLVFPILSIRGQSVAYMANMSRPAATTRTVICVSEVTSAVSRLSSLPERGGESRSARVPVSSPICSLPLSVRNTAVFLTWLGLGLGLG